MILQALHDLFGRLSDDDRYQLAPRGQSHQRVTFIVVLDRNGDLFDIVDARLQSDGRAISRRVLVLGEAKPSGSGFNPCFLWDNSKYLLGCDPAPDASDKSRSRALEAFDAFRTRHLDIRQELDDDGFHAVCNFLENWSPARGDDYPILAELATGFGVFQIRGETSFVHERPKIRGWWASKHDGGSTESTASSAPCLITGQNRPTARLHPKIKGVRGAQSSGAALVGFNDKAYESYGKTQGFNAPVSEEAAHQYATALNALLDGPEKRRHVIELGGMTTVFWTEKPSLVEDVFAAFHSGVKNAKDPAQDDAARARLESFLKALRTGRESYGEIDDDPDRTEYFILGLGPNAARVSVRSFRRSSVADLLDNLRRHFRDISIERSQERHEEFPSLWRLIRQTGREAKDTPPNLAAPMLDAMIGGRPYPTSIFQAVMRRIRADRDVNFDRACILKGYLVRNLHKEIPMTLDTSRSAPPYRLGRLFAALEKTQKDALGEGLNATIRDRFYSSASATPGAVFPRLLRTYQHHLAKLEGGRKINRDKLVQEIFEDLDQIPTHLDTAGQAEFALGYYHQMSSFYRRKDAESQAGEND